MTKFHRLMGAWGGDPKFEVEETTMNSIDVERFCLCGGKLVAKAKNEEEARSKVEAFLSDHRGRELGGTVHGPMRRGAYWQMVRRLRKEQRESVEAKAKEILEEGRLSPKSRRYRLK